VVVRAWQQVATPFFCAAIGLFVLDALTGILYHAPPCQNRCFLVKTFVAKDGEVRGQWYLIDAADKILGKVASEAARRLRGKHRVDYTPNVDTGDYVIVINANKVRVSGNKTRNKYYFSYSGHQGGLKRTSFADQQSQRPERLVEHAVRGMLPRTPMGRAMFRKLKVYGGGSHKHTAQSPKPLGM
jgi:large subunit ribosomal protein L13